MKIMKRVYCAEFEYDKNDIRKYSEDRVLLHEHLIAESDDWLLLLTKVNMSIEKLIEFRDSDDKVLLIHEYHGAESYLDGTNNKYVEILKEVTIEK